MEHTEDIPTNYREFTEKDLIFVKQNIYPDEMSKLFENMITTSFKACELTIKEKSRYIIKFIYFYKSYEFKSRNCHCDYIHKSICIAIDNYGEMYNIEISTTSKCNGEIIPFELPPFVADNYDEHVIELSKPLIDLILETEWGCNCDMDNDTYTSMSYADKYIVLFESFLSQLKIVNKKIYNHTI
jgi:hypothetical protein